MPNNRRQQLLVLNGAIIAGITSAFMLMVMKPSAQEPQPVPQPDPSLKAKVDIALTNVAHNVVEANMAVGRMNINQTNKTDCDALLAANRQVAANVDFVRVNNPKLLEAKQISTVEAKDTDLLLQQIMDDKDAPRFVTEKRCLTLN